MGSIGGRARGEKLRGARDGCTLVYWLLSEEAQVGGAAASVACDNVHGSCLS